MTAQPLNKPLRQPTRRFSLMLAVGALLASPAGLAEQRLDLEGTAIFGNRESPNILYVVPWRGSNQIAPMEPPRIGRLDEILAPLDREVFRRQVDLQRTFGEKP